jgi:hypothetical protein
MGGYLFRVVERMDRTNLSRRDPKLYQLVRAAEDAPHRLWVELHYQSCGHGVGRPPAPDTDPDPPPGGAPEA